MDVYTLFCKIFIRYKGEKTAAAAFHLLRGKRSGQTIQDVNYYQLKNYFGLLPKLGKEKFDGIVEELIRKQMITLNEEQIVLVTQKGKKAIRGSRKYGFDGWHYRGQEIIFFERLALLVQTLSNIRVGERKFMPIQRNVDIQQFIKQTLREHPIDAGILAEQLKNEMIVVFNEANVSGHQKRILTHRLSGYQLTGWTWQQLATALHTDPINVTLSFIESLHGILNAIYQAPARYPLLQRLAHQIKITHHLTDSTTATKQLFDQGKTIEDIARIRNLKISTIEDHFVELAFHEENFPFGQFVTHHDMIEVQQYSIKNDTKKLRPLKEAFPQLSYFQIRLILSAPLKGEM